MAGRKKKETPKKPGGRPKKEVNWKQVDGLCRFHAPANEIADYLSTQEVSISYDTLDRRAQEDHGVSFAEYVRQKQNGWGKTRLRQLQWNAAEAGNVSMLIWLGKQYLGQRDKVDTDPDAKPQPVTVNIQVEDGRRT